MRLIEQRRNRTTQPTSGLAVKGFTLMELMIVVAIIGILASIAVPAYNGQMERGRRAECRSAVLQVMQQQERRFTSMATYATDLAGTGMRTVSGDNAANSACDVSAVRTDGSTAANITSVRVVGTMRAGMDRTVESVTIDTAGLRQCSLRSATGTLVTGNTTCWP